MSSRQRLQDLRRSPEATKEYLDWLSDPITLLVLGAMREYGRPRAPVAANNDSVQLLLGESIGWNGAADLMETALMSTTQPEGTMEASYGAVKPE